MQQSQRPPSSTDKSVTHDVDSAAAVAMSSSQHSSSAGAEHQHEDPRSPVAQGSASSESTGHAGSADSNNSSSESGPSQQGWTQPAAWSVIDSDAAAVLAEEQDVWCGVLNSQDAMAAAVQAACLLPNALRISSVTQDGIHNLQLAVMHLLSDETAGTAQQPVV